MTTVRSIRYCALAAAAPLSSAASSKSVIPTRTGPVQSSSRSPSRRSRRAAFLDPRSTPGWPISDSRWIYSGARAGWCVELDGRRYHWHRKARDAERDRILSAAGFAVQRYGWGDVVSGAFIERMVI